MKRWLIGLLMLLVLTGCTQQPESTTADTTPTPTAPPATLYEPNSELEQQTGGAVKTFPLGTDGCLSVQPMGEYMLTVCLDTNGAVELTVLTADTGIVKASATLEGIASGSIRAGSDRIACYSAVENCILLLDSAMNEVDRVFLPSGIEGDVLVDEALANVYFCTGNQIRALALATETPRLVHQHDCLHQTLHSVILKDTVLACQVEDNEGSYLEFIDAATGQTLGKDDTTWQLDTWQDRYFLRRFDGSVAENLFGAADSQLQQLNVHDQTILAALAVNGVVSVTDSESGLHLSFFDLDSGKRIGDTLLPGRHAVYSLCGQPDSSAVWFIYEDSELCQDILCRWDISMLGCSDETVYTTRRYTAEAPDTEGLALCTQRAAQLNETYGINIVFEGPLTQPEDYTLTPEFQVSLINQGLDALEAGLSALPEGFVKELSGVSGSELYIALVRDILSVSGHTPADGTGLQYWSGKDACIALCATEQTLADFYHQLFHVLETYLYSESSELDLWDDLNPKGFRYDNSYYFYTQHEGSEHLTKERAFIDAFSMTYAREDRATIFEYAMLAGNGELFSSETMQEKLHRLSYCIRDAYGWRKSELTYPWEQYLEESLAYKKRK